MSAASSSTDPPSFLSLATRHSFLAAEATIELAQEAASRGVDPAQLALERGLLDGSQVEALAALLRPTETIPGYEILDLLGRGGMGVVFRARQVNLNRPVALKTVLVGQRAKATALARFEQEAVTTAQLRHPHIVTVYDFGRHAGRLFLAMELIEGRDLAQHLEQQGRLTEAEAWGLARQAAAGLAHAAKCGVVHRDVKPPNLLLVEPPVGYPLPPGLPMVKVTDFGLASLAAEQPTDDRLTVAGTTLGSPRYMAPEQVENANVDHRADIYALGATVYHLLAGQPPFNEPALGQVLARKLTGEPEPLEVLAPGLSHQTLELVAAMMARDKSARIADYATLLARIDSVLGWATASGTLTPAIPQVKLTRPPVDGSGFPATDGLPASSSRNVPGEQPPSVALRRATWFSKWNLAFLIGAGLCAGGTVWYFSYPHTGTQADLPLAPTGQVMALFDGRNVAAWRTQGGAWRDATDSEGGRVLSGEGRARRALPPWLNYRLEFGVALNKAKRIELHFALPADEAMAAPHYALTWDGARAGLMLVAADGTMEFVEVREVEANEPAEAPTYHSLRAERGTGRWRAAFDGIEFAPLPFDDAPGYQEFELRAIGGPAWFEALEATELAPTTTAAP
jgi:serine/threonine protein kinase